MVLDIRDPIQLGPPIKNKAITDHFEPRQKLGEAKTIKKVIRSKFFIAKKTYSFNL